MWLHKIKLGLSDLPGYGPHPGTVIVLVLIAFGGFGGADLEHSLLGGLMGMLIMTACFGPLYLLGAYGRGDSYLKHHR
jgi:hypothetical protein